MTERKEALMRILVGIVSGIILHLWWIPVKIAAIINFIWTLISGKRCKALSRFCYVWVDQFYKFIKYMVFATNKRVFPFAELGKPIEKADFTLNPNKKDEGKKKKSKSRKKKK